MCSDQSELAEIIEAEAIRLGGLTSRVLRTSRLDTEDVKPRLERTDITELVLNLVEQYSRQCTNQRPIWLSKRYAERVRIFNRCLPRQLHVQSIGTLLEPWLYIASQ